MFLMNENCILRQIYVIYPIPLYIYMLHNYVKMTQGTHTTELNQQLWWNQPGNTWNQLYKIYLLWVFSRPTHPPFIYY